MPSQTLSQDHPMTENPPEAEGDACSHQATCTHEDWLRDKQRIRVLPGASDSAASFEFEDEDHTLGNPLRYIIMKNPDVEFCGYSIPHPSEAKMNVRIQTYDGTVYDALEKGLNDLAELCDVVTDKFTAARHLFSRQQT